MRETIAKTMCVLSLFSATAVAAERAVRIPKGQPQLFLDDVEHHYRQITEHDEIDLTVPAAGQEGKGAA